MNAEPPFDAINPEALGKPRGWTNGMLAPERGRILFVAGQTARDGSGAMVSDDIAAQWDQALANVLAVLHAVGGSAEQIGRMTVYVTDAAGYREARKALRDVWRRHMGRHYPAMTVVEVAGLVDEGAVVEIEATAVL